jgi:hypothetical protein
VASEQLISRSLVVIFFNFVYRYSVLIIHCKTKFHNKALVVTLLTACPIVTFACDSVQATHMRTYKSKRNRVTTHRETDMEPVKKFGLN